MSQSQSRAALAAGLSLSAVKRVPLPSWPALLLAGAI